MGKTVGKKLMVLVIFILAAVFCSMVYSHCQIPCGIYRDPARLDMMAEHITTIEKSMNEITRLSGEKERNMNQIVRWVRNKDAHADELSNIVTYYFMAQRIKPVGEAEKEAYAKYVRKLALLHKMVFYATRCKQTTDLANVQELRRLLARFRKAYFEDIVHKH